MLNFTLLDYITKPAISSAQFGRGNFSYISVKKYKWRKIYEPHVPCYLMFYLPLIFLNLSPFLKFFESAVDKASI